MKKIKVYLQFPWNISDSQYYKSLIENPPEGVEYKNTTSRIGMISSGKKLAWFNFLKRQIRSWTKKFGMVIVNSHLTKTNGDFDLIHCAHCLSKNLDKPWVADFESWWQMWISGRDSIRGRDKVLEILKRKECKKILTWTPAAKVEIEKKFPEIKNKLEVVTFAMPFRKIKKKNKKEKVLLFVSRYFFHKGGLHALEVFDRITKQEKNVRAILVSDVPENIKEKYSLNKKIQIHGLMSSSKIIKEIFPMADIFVYPGYSDTFGFVFVEALSFGLPIVTVEGFSRNFIVKDGETGFIIKKDAEIEIEALGKKEEIIVQRMVEKTLTILKDEKLRRKMSQNCIEEVKNGKFSIKERNSKLKKIYEGAII
ncbi:MAG: glycosyltransferase family 4 protein [Nanoarchaeota archaeon]